jgi:hypothetical protein
MNAAQLLSQTSKPTIFTCGTALMADAMALANEWAVGDISYDAKQRFPAVAQMCAEIEARELDLQGFKLANLTARETRMLKLCDHLDAWLWMMRHARHLAGRSDWREQRQHMLNEAGSLSVYYEVEYLVDVEECRV